MLLGMLTGRIESVGVEDFWGVAVVVEAVVVGGAEGERLSSSFFSSNEAAGGAFGASPPLFAELPPTPAPSFLGSVAAVAPACGTSVAMLFTAALYSWPVVVHKE